MIRINLLPFRAARKKENVRRQISIFLLSFALVLILVVWYNYFLAGQIAQKKSRNQETSAQIAKYEEINREIAGIKKKLQTLEQKIKVIEQLDGKRRHAVALLESMTQVIVPERMWFTYLDIKDNNIAIRGIALDERTIADFMTNLENNRYVDVTLKSLDQKAISGNSLNLKAFSITLVKSDKTVDSPKKAKAS